MSKGGKLALIGFVVFCVAMWITQSYPDASHYVAVPGVLSLPAMVLGAIWWIVDKIRGVKKPQTQHTQPVVVQSTPVVPPQATVESKNDTQEEYAKQLEMLEAKQRELEERLAQETRKAREAQTALATQKALTEKMKALEEEIPQPKSTFDDWLEKQRIASTIVSTAIVDTTMKSKTKASATSSVVRGAVGGALFGPVGMVAGAVTPKKKTITKAKNVTFSVRYANGECRLETVKNGSARFKELAKYIA